WAKTPGHGGPASSSSHSIPVDRLRDIVCPGHLTQSGTSRLKKSGAHQYRQAQSLKRVEVHSHAIEAYNLLNSVAVSNPENLRAFDSFGRPETADDDNSRRRRWCAFIWLEALQVTFAALKGKLIDERYANQALSQQLEVVLQDDLVFWLVGNRGFDPDFVNYCTAIRRRIAPGKPITYSEEDAIKGISKNRE
ncbi:MAG: hypothetical protein NTY19_16290, partial [Planctomycetota bacterium]|nr:hypothetical protein [Planctomycetota bacterium]